MSADQVLASGGAGRTPVRPTGGEDVRHAAPGQATDEAPVLDARARAAFAGVADHLIPAAHGMPSAADVVGDRRLRFVLTARPDLREPFVAALRPGVGDGSGAGRLAVLEAEPDLLAALLQVVVFGYYTDADVRDRLGYPGQMAKTLYSWKVPDFIEEGLTDRVLARGPVWRDPRTGRRAEPSTSSAHAPSPDRRGDVR